MATYYVTIGVQYAHEPHPVFTTGPDDLISIEADSENAARAKLVDALGWRHASKWSFIYDRQTMTPEMINQYHPGDIVPLHQAIRTDRTHVVEAMVTYQVEDCGPDTARRAVRALVSGTSMKHDETMPLVEMLHLSTTVHPPGAEPWDVDAQIQGAKGE